MKFDKFSVIFSCVVFCLVIFQPGCEEENSRQEQMLDPAWFDQPAWQQIRSSAAVDQRAQEQNAQVMDQTPQIEFDSSSHDFGRISPGSLHVCEFNFKNTGNSNLVISDVQTSCSSCTRALVENDKMVYAPGESGKIIVNYADTELGETLKHVYVYSNDPENPRAELALQAALAAPIDIEPKKLSLSLISANGACPQIVVRSLDNQPFSITGFESTGNCISVKFNPQAKSSQYVLQPQVDMGKLNASPSDGSFRIYFSRPDCEVVSGTFYAPPRFAASPRNITVRQADPRNAIIKTIYVTSNYGESFTVQPSVSDSRLVKVIDSQPVRSGYQLTVQITPPARDDRTNMVSDNINLTLKGIGNIVIPCNVYYPGAPIPVHREEAPTQCKTCGPKRLDLSPLRPGYR